MTDYATETLGIFAVTLMVVAYALEPRSPTYVAAFAIGCVLAAVYAALAGAYAFVLAESIWAIVAYNRFRMRSSVKTNF